MRTENTALAFQTIRNSIPENPAADGQYGFFVAPSLPHFVGIWAAPDAADAAGAGTSADASVEVAEAAGAGITAAGVSRTLPVLAGR